MDECKPLINGCVYRVFPSGEVQYLHPKDGVYPEKVNKAGPRGLHSFTSELNLSNSRTCS